MLDYGIPDFSALSARARRGPRETLPRSVAQSIAAFEPRLRDVRVLVEGLRSNDRVLMLRIDAMLVVGDHAEPVSFPLLVRAGEVELEGEGEAE